MKRILEIVFGQQSKNKRKWNESTNHELFEPEREHPDGTSSPDWTPVMYRSCTRKTRRTEGPLVNSFSECAVWETYRPEHLIIKSSDDKAGVSSVNLDRLSTCIVRFNQHIKTKFDDDDDREEEDNDDNDNDDDDDDGDGDGDGEGDGDNDDDDHDYDSDESDDDDVDDDSYGDDDDDADDDDDDSAKIT